MSKAIIYNESNSFHFEDKINWLIIHDTNRLKRKKMNTLTLLTIIIQHLKINISLDLIMYLILVEMKLY